MFNISELFNKYNLLKHNLNVWLILQMYGFLILVNN